MKRLIYTGVIGACLLGACHNHDHSHDQDPTQETHTNEAATTGHIHSDEIVFPAEKAKTAGIRVAAIQKKTFRQVIPTSGQIVSAQGDESMVVANLAGVVSFPSAVTEGMPVRKGMPLATLSSEDMPDGNPVQRVKAEYEIALKEYERAQTLLKDRIISEKEYNGIKQIYENARISYEAVARNQTEKGQAVTAPTSGYIKSCLVKEGDYVTTGQPLFSVTQNRRLLLRAELSERHYGYLKSIVSANFETPYDNRTYSLDDLGGRLLSYGKASGTDSFYLPVTFEFDNRGDIIPGSYVTVYLLSAPMTDVLALPRTALTEEQGTYFVYLQTAPDEYRKQEVKPGADNGQEVQILAGLQAGDKVVVEGAYQLKLAGATHAIPAHSHEH